MTYQPTDEPPPIADVALQTKPRYKPPRRLRSQRGVPRSRTLNAKHIGRGEPLSSQDELDLLHRPRTWGECSSKTGPCPWAGCVAHRFLDVKPNGSIVLNFPSLEDPMDLEDPCVLRIAERGAVSLERTGEYMNLTRERVRQVELAAMLRLKRSGAL